MRTVKSIPAAEAFLRKLCGEPSSFSIRTSRVTTMLTNGHSIEVEHIRIVVETEDKLTVDSLPQSTLQKAFDIVCERVTTARAQLASKRNTEANRLVASIASRSPEVHG